MVCNLNKTDSMALLLCLLSKSIYLFNIHTYCTYIYETNSGIGLPRGPLLPREDALSNVAIILLRVALIEGILVTLV